jgi:hypothetical protein
MEISTIDEFGFTFEKVLAHLLRWRARSALQSSVLTSFATMRRSKSSEVIAMLGKSLIEDRDGLQSPAVDGIKSLSNIEFIANSKIRESRFRIKRNSGCSGCRSHDFAPKSVT